MAIHGVVSTYFGDLEYDIGKSLNWTQYYCDTMFVFDANTADDSRQYVVDWEAWLPKAKYAFSNISYFGSPQNAATWRETSFDLARAAWGYDADDWVLFIDGTEALNVFHAPPTEVTTTLAEVDGPAGEMTLTFDAAHGMVAGNILLLRDTAVVQPVIAQTTYAYTNGAASDVWTITHNLWDYPSYDNLVTTPTASVVGVEYPDRNTIVITFDQVTDGSVDIIRAEIPESEHVISGTYFVKSVPTATTAVVDIRGIIPTFGPEDTVLASNAAGTEPLASFTTEPAGYYDGLIFQCWLFDEINKAEAAGKDQISLDAWALIRSSPPEAVDMRLVAPDFASVIPGATIDGITGDATVAQVRCDEYYVSMQRLVRLAKVSALLDPGFDWGSLDQPAASFTDARAADNLSLISYAYVRWADKPTDMTQAVDPDAPHYVAGDAIDPPLRPVSVDLDVGFAMRRLISTVRPIGSIPLVWGSADPDGTQPMVGSVQKLDTTYVERFAATPDGSTFTGYTPYGGSPLYPGVLRANLREGVFYIRAEQRAVSIPVATVAFTDPVITVVTARKHYLDDGTRITLHGINSAFDPMEDGYGLFEGDFDIAQVIDPYTFTIFKQASGLAVPTTPTPLGRAVTMPDGFGQVPWNYLLNGLGVSDPDAWIMRGNVQTPVT